MRNERINRRLFLKRSVKTAATAVGFPYIIRSSAFGKTDRLAPSNRITMGCIGVGGQGFGNSTHIFSPGLQ